MESNRTFHTPLEVERGHEMHMSWRDRISDVRSSMNTRVSGLGSSMRSNPSKWAGIAAGAGLILGMGSRMMMKRA